MRTLILAVAAVLLAAPTARAQSALDAATAPIEGRHFGSRGTFAISNDANFTLGYVTQTGGGNGAFVLNLAPAMDYFLQDHLSLGGQVIFSVVSGSNHTDVGFGVVPRVGYELRLNPYASLWPRGGIELTTNHTFRGFASYPGTPNGGFGINVDAPVLFHATEHFFLGGGPAIHAQLSGDDPHLLTFTLNFVMGGWM